MENVTSSSFFQLTTTLSSTTPENANKIFFSWYDYLLFTIMLSISGLIGIYFGCFGSKQSTANEYLLGGKKMKVIPVAISLVASHTSGITLLALPADVYIFGATYWLGGISMMVLSGITVYAFLPVFYNLKLTSTYEYLGKRFDERTRKLSSILFGFALFLYLPIVIYIPALAFSAATGIDVHIITPVVCGVCIFYTTIGGLKALVWSDTLQFTVTVGAMTTILILGVNMTGGFGAVWQKSVEGHRLDVFDFDPALTKRESFWAVIVGLTIHWIAHSSVNQGCMQKFLSVATLRESKITVVLYCFGMTMMKTLSVLTGLAMFARYSDCDPFTVKKVEKNDQLLPYYVMDVAGKVPGLSGLFIAGVFGAALSTLSGNLNSLAGTIYEDFIKEPLQKRGIKKEAGYILKIIVLITGIISTLLVYIVEHLGGLLAISIGLGSVAHGPLLSMFSLGFFFPRANPKGAFYGGIISTVIMGTVVSGCNYYKSQKIFKYPARPVSVDGCNITLSSNISSILNTTMTGVGEDVVSPIFRISFYWYTMLGAIIGITSGLIISYLTEKNDPPVPRKLLSPAIYPFLPKDKYSENGVDLEYYSVKEALEKTAGNDPIKREEYMRKASYITDVIDD